jgi:hypothetical protein
MLTSAEKGVLAQVSVNHQMQHWLSESDKEAPWTPFSLTASSAGHVAANTVIEGDLEDLLDNTTTQTRTNGNSNA